MHAATKTNDPLEASIGHATLIQAEAEHIYSLLTTGAGWDAWFTAGARVDARPGGDITFRWRNWGPDAVNADDGGTVMEAQSPRRLVFQRHPGGPEYATTVEINLEPRGGGTVVRPWESGYPTTPGGIRAIVECATGWGEALTLLKFYVEHGIRMK